MTFPPNKPIRLLCQGSLMQSWMDADQILQISEARVQGTKHPEKVWSAGLGKVCPSLFLFARFVQGHACMWWPTWACFLCLTFNLGSQNKSARALPGVNATFFLLLFIDSVWILCSSQCCTVCHPTFVQKADYVGVKRNSHSQHHTANSWLQLKHVFLSRWYWGFLFIVPNMHE